MRYLFIVQGEGRGHMTQAISLFNILTNNGHEVSHVIVGKSKRRKIPSFFTEQLKSCEITPIESPNFITDKSNKSINIGATLFANLSKIKTFKKSLRTIHDITQSAKPDVIINFYDFLGGFYKMLFRCDCYFVCIAHQYLAMHEDFPFAKGRIWDKISLKLGNAITAYKADRIMALSFTSDYRSNSKITISPPLLRKEITSLQSHNNGFILVYMVNDGYAEEVFNFHKSYPEIPLQCFWDRDKAAEIEIIDDTLTFHQINDKKFLEKMSECMAYASTAGFESICEAFYLDKPVMMVPVAGQYEQACNALDGLKAGVGIYSKNFDIIKLINFLPEHQSKSNQFREWSKLTEEIMSANLTNF